MCFINQQHDAKFIASAQGRDLMARALANGILMWKKQR
jgi:N-acetylmuramoyl-L-alanine amidase